MRVRVLSVRSRRTRDRCRARLFLRDARAVVFGTSLSLASTSSCSLKPFGKSSGGSLWRISRRSHLHGYRLRFRLLYSALGNVFPLINPTLHAYDAVRRVSFGCTVVNVGAQRLQRQTALQVPFLACDFRSIQASGHANLDALAAEAQRGIDGLAHGPAEGDALFELQGDRLSDQRGIEFRPVNFLDVDVHFALGALLDFALELIDFRALAPDDDSGAGGKEANHKLVRGALDVDRADPGRFQAVL